MIHNKVKRTIINSLEPSLKFSTINSTLIRMRIHIILLLFGFLLHNVNSQTIVPFNSSYKYLKGSQAGMLLSAWNSPEFNDLAWSMANAPFRYGDGSDGLLLSDMMNNYTTLYLRKILNINNADSIDKISIASDFDDGYIIWINGIEISKYNAPSNPTYNSLATNNHESGDIYVTEIDIEKGTLVEGENILAIQCFNVSKESSDFMFDLSIDVKKSIPTISDSLNVLFSKQSGYYDSIFDLTLSSPDTNLQIAYTLDCGEPIESANTIYTSGETITIDPESTFGNRGTTPAVVVKAALYKNGFETGYTQSRTFIFLEKVKEQVYPGGDWPNGSVNNQVYDYEMDPDIITDRRYQYQIDTSLKSLPVISITTTSDNLFNPSFGIYSNPGMRSFNAERECNIELIQDNNNKGFNLNAGIRIRGGASRSTGNPKHSFRVFFRGIYGYKALRYPLFDEEGTDRYEKIDLRTAQNYSWNGDSEENRHNTFIRDVFSRDAQKELGQPYTRSRYYHLYLNGMYWGIYQTQERAEARFAESYFGGDKDDYDVVKVSPVNFPYSTETTDGNDEAWNEIYNKCNAGFENNTAYFGLEGLSAMGFPKPGQKKLLDIDNLIDYMLVVFYTGNFDAPVSAFWGNRMPNNFYGIYNREDNSKGFIFCAHDSEHSLMIDPVYTGSGLYENRTDLTNHPDNWFVMSMEKYADFHPQWIHEKLTYNKEYRIRFAERAAELFEENGLFTPDKVKSLLDKRIEEVQLAIIAESARWGDSKSSPARNKIDHWIPEVNEILNVFVPQRTQIVIDQLKNVGLYPEITSVQVSIADTLVLQKEIQFTGSISLKFINPNNNGNIYYTLDGSDPRMTNGLLSESAIEANNNSAFLTNHSEALQIRIKDGSKWSAPKTIYLYNNTEDYSSLKVTELNYHPYPISEGNDTIIEEDLEFIELKNTGDHALNLSNVQLDSSVQYIVPPNTLLPPGGFFVIASKPRYFYKRYGIEASGNYTGHFSNSGEHVVILDPNGETLINFQYSDTDNWPWGADGDGYSLVSETHNPSGYPGDASYWKTSTNIYGNPFLDDGEVFENISSESFKEISLFPNPSKGLLNIQLPEINQNTTIEVLSLDGTLIHTNNSYGNHLIVNLPDILSETGMYLVKITSGSSVQVMKFIYIKQ